MLKVMSSGALSEDFAQPLISMRALTSQRSRRDGGAIAGDSEVPGVNQPKLHGRKDGKEEKELLEGSFRIIAGRRAVHDSFCDICCGEGSIIVLYKFAVGPDDLVRLLGVPAGRKEAGAGIDIPGGQPETVHEIVIGAKRRQLVRGSTADQDSKCNGAGKGVLTHTVRLVLAEVRLKSRTKRMRERRIWA